MLRPRLVVLALGCTVSATLTLTSCTTSTPAQLSASASSTVLVDPEPTPTDSLLTDPAPTDSTVGALAPGFPAHLVPVPDGATVLVSSAVPAPDSDLVAISLNLQTTQSVDDLVHAISAPLKKAGFTRTDPEDKEPDLAAQASFSRDDGKEHVILGVLDQDGTRTLTLSGMVKPDVA